MGSISSSKKATPQERVAGAIVGLFVGDATGLGPHWYYDLDELRRDFGVVEGYTSPKASRPYNAKQRAGEWSQTAQLARVLLDSIAEKGEFLFEDFTERLDKFFEGHQGGAQDATDGRYTSGMVRDLLRWRKEGVAWSEIRGSSSNSSEAAILSVVLAARYAGDLEAFVKHSSRLIRLLVRDPEVRVASAAFASTVAALINDVPLDAKISQVLMEQVKSGELPFKADATTEEIFDSPQDHALHKSDAFMLPGCVAKAAHEGTMVVSPLYNVASVYGLSCKVDYVLPAAYYIAASHETFYPAVLDAVNGGGDAVGRGACTGALVGAKLGIKSVAEEVIAGLDDHEAIVELANKVAGLCFVSEE